jgi:hypothetical protein
MGGVKLNDLVNANNHRRICVLKDLGLPDKEKVREGPDTIN